MMNGISSTILGIGFVASLVVAKPVATVDFPGRTYSPTPRDLAKKAVAPGLLRSAVRLATEAQNRRLEARRLRRLRGVLPPLPARQPQLRRKAAWFDYLICMEFAIVAVLRLSCVSAHQNVTRLPARR